MTSRYPIAALAPLAMAFLTACSDAVAPKAPVPHVVAASGGGQSAAVLDTLPEWLVVRVVDDAGEPRGGIPIVWSSDDETSITIPVDPVTRPDGTARALAVLGLSSGAKRFHARAEGYDDRATFEVTATTGRVLKAVSLMNASGASHMCALDAEGRAWCWGVNSSGQLGDGTTAFGEAARPALTAQRFRSIAGTYRATCAIALDQSLWCWGNGGRGSGEGSFGNGTPEESLVPVPAAGGLSVIDVDLDFETTCVLTTAREAWCWGRVITPDGNITSATPVKVESSERWRDISVSGSARVCAVSLEYEVYCWAAGSGSAQTAGIEGDHRSPQRVRGIPPAIEVTVSQWNQCAQLTIGARAVCWGDPFLNGVLSTTPIQYPSLDGAGFARVRAREESVMALGTDGALRIWGEPPQCCDGYLSAIPAPLNPRGPWIDFSFGNGAFGILAADSTVHFWYPFPGFGSPTEVRPRPVLMRE